MLPINF